MGKSFEALCADADRIISGRTAGEKLAAAPRSEIEKLAAELLAPAARPVPAVKTAEEAAPLGAETTCKLAHARAIMDGFINLPLLTKMAAIEERAREAGKTDEEISAFFQKHAAQFRFRSCLESADWLQEG